MFGKLGQQKVSLDHLLCDILSDTGGPQFRNTIEPQVSVAK